ncbi:MAG: hypothetical protein ILP19_07460 [Oscillospiraceae bacterium]|nr:hypothetical protein [Oscillospiraceae bacterium]
MDIKAKIEEVMNKAKTDPEFAAKLQSDPVKTVEDIVGIDLPDDKINAVAETIKAKIAAGETDPSKLAEAVQSAIGGSAIDGVKDAIAGFFGGNK